MKIVCIFLLIAACSAKPDKYLDALQDEFEKMGELKDGVNGVDAVLEPEPTEAPEPEATEGPEPEHTEAPEPEHTQPEPEHTQPEPEPTHPGIPDHVVKELVKEAGDTMLTGIMFPIEKKRSCHHLGCMICYHKCLPCLECIGTDHPACALCHKCSPCVQCLHCFDIKNAKYLF